MRQVLPVLLVGAVVAGGVLALNGGETANAGVPNSPAVSAGETYRVSAAGAGISCTLSKLGEAGASLFALRVDRACDALLPGLAAARYWRENADGSVGIGANPAGELVTLAVADGAAYESFRPANPLLTLKVDE